MPLDWQVWLAERLTNGDLEALPRVLLFVGAMVGTTSFALVHWLTLWGTRWGDQHATIKSFWLSLVVHVAVFCSWVTAVKVQANYAAAPAVIAPIERIPIQDLGNFEAPALEPAKSLLPVNSVPWEAANTSVVERQRPERFDQSLAEETPPPPPTPRDPVDDVVDTSSDLIALSQPGPEVPEPQSIPTTSDSLAEATPDVRATPAPAAPPPLVSESEQSTEARPEAPVAATPARMSAGALPQELPEAAELQIPAGTAQRPDETLSAVPTSAIPLPQQETSPDPLPSAVAGEEMVRSAAPLATGEVSETTGITGGPSEPIVPGIPVGAPRFSRTRTPTTTNIGTGSNELVDPSTFNRPSTPDAAGMSEDPLAVATIGRSGYGDVAGIDTTVPLPNPTESELPIISRRPARVPQTYELRSPDRRRQTALERGGSIESEQAVNRALEWLATSQEAAGFWDAGKHGGGASAKDPQGVDRLGGGKEAHAGVTGLAVLAFLGAGQTPNQGEHTETVSRAIRWLIGQQRADGYLGGTATYYDAMYCHAIATFALAETLAIGGAEETVPGLARAVEKGVRFIITMQNDDGGWRYRKGQVSDMSMFGWQLMALNSAKNAGVQVPQTTWTPMIRFLKERSQGTKGGLAAYRKGERPSPVMTAEALFCKQVIGISATNPASLEAIQYLRQNLPRRSKPDNYYWYYGTLAMRHHGGADWEDWNNALRDTLVVSQRTSGPLAGTWDPIDPWGGIGGRIYSTALATMCLEVYYRYSFEKGTPPTQP